MSLIEPLQAYSHDGYTRVAIANFASSNLTSVAIGDVEFATDVACDLPLEGGIDTRARTNTVDRTGWTEGPRVNAPTRPEWDLQLTGFRGAPPRCPNVHVDPETCCAGVLWSLVGCGNNGNNRFRCKSVIYIRRGVPVEEPWAVGQEVEAYAFWWGQPWVHPTARDFVLFTVPLLVFNFNLCAVVESCGLNLDGSFGAFASTPDSAALNVSDSSFVTVSAFITPDQWARGTDQTIWSHGDGLTDGYVFQLDQDGHLLFRWWDGTTSHEARTTAPLPWNDGNRRWVTVDFSLSIGSVSFRTRLDGGDDVFLPGPPPVGQTQLIDSSDNVTVGALAEGTEPFVGSIQEAELFTDQGRIAHPTFRFQSPGTVQFTDDEGNVWTLEDRARITSLCGQQLCGQPLCTNTGNLLVTPAFREYGDALYGDLEYGGETGGAVDPCDGQTLCNC